MPFVKHFWGATKIYKNEKFLHDFTVNYKIFWWLCKHLRRGFSFPTGFLQDLWNLYKTFARSYKILINVHGKNWFQKMFFMTSLKLRFIMDNLLIFFWIFLKLLFLRTPSRGCSYKRHQKYMVIWSSPLNFFHKLDLCELLGKFPEQHSITGNCTEIAPLKLKELLSEGLEMWKWI